MGKTWTISFLLDDIKTDYNYTIKSIDNEIANVELTSNVSTNKKMETQGMEIVTKLSGTLLSTILVDTKTNLVKSNISTSSQKGSIEIMGQSSPMEVTTTNKILFE